MRRKFTPRGSWLLVALLSVWLGSPAAAQNKSLPAASELSAGQVDGFLRRAQKFEVEQRWGEALSVYEEALRELPDEPTLGNRHDLAKIHYDLSRRYSDSSFLRALGTLPERQAIGLYTEVLVKIESHYVTAPDWAALLARGTQDLAVALAEKPFQQRNLSGKTGAQIDAFAQRLRRLMQNRTVHSRQEAIDMLAAVIQLGNQQLQLPPASVAFEYACGAIGALDPYSSYLTSDQLTDVYSQIEGNFVGLGIELKASNNALQIVKVITGSPADRAGLRAGDRITEVDGKATATMTTDQAADLLQGQEGSLVRITTLTPSDAVRRLSVRREHVEVPSVDDVKIADPDYGIGYLNLTCFQKTTSRDLDTALWKLHREGMRSLIIDLRKNPGGLLTSSVEVADKFVEDGVIVSTRGRSALEDFNYTAHKVGTWRVPLVVLIDGDSASASEIFAGAIRDHHRGILVGQRSYGKGSVQGIFPLSLAGSGVRLTTAKFYSPNGHPISHVGVQPDIVVQLTAKPLFGAEDASLKDAEDPTLAAGLEAARRQTAKR
ncbi:MAG TPA: S41 family peptidase [Pirellulales bacterium]|jgi:carboxyl-terminal processing protease|nr:S41 family peptidase [Pirellulales bacterium]